MKKDIILAGVGGQGILSIATVIGAAAIRKGLFIKQSEVHGMSQRGGDVQSHFRISPVEIASDLIPEGQADMIISVEPMEALRYLPMLHENGWLITNTKPFINVANYPDEEKLINTIKSLPKSIALDADNIARKLGSAKSMNMVVLGASANFLGIEVDAMEKAIEHIFMSKGTDMIRLNLQAFRAGLAFVEKQIA